MFLLFIVNCAGLQYLESYVQLCSKETLHFKFRKFLINISKENSMRISRLSYDNLLCILLFSQILERCHGWWRRFRGMMPWITFIRVCETQVGVHVASHGEQCKKWLEVNFAFINKILSLDEHFRRDESFHISSRFGWRIFADGRGGGSRAANTMR